MLVRLSLSPNLSFRSELHILLFGSISFLKISLHWTVRPNAWARRGDVGEAEIGSFEVSEQYVLCFATFKHIELSYMVPRFPLFGPTSVLAVIATICNSASAGAMKASYF